MISKAWSNFDLGGAILIAVLLSTLIVALVVLIWGAFNLEQPAPAFSADVRGIVERCAESSTSTYNSNINGSVFTNKSSDGDALLRCLYESNITINFHGDPVEMRDAE